MTRSVRTLSANSSVRHDHKLLQKPPSCFSDSQLCRSACCCTVIETRRCRGIRYRLINANLVGFPRLCNPIPRHNEVYLSIHIIFGWTSRIESAQDCLKPRTNSGIPIALVFLWAVAQSFAANCVHNNKALPIYVITEFICVGTNSKRGQSLAIYLST